MNFGILGGAGEGSWNQSPTDTPEDSICFMPGQIQSLCFYQGPLMSEFHNYNLINYPDRRKETSYFQFYTWSKTECYSHVISVKLKKAAHITNKFQFP